MALDDGTVLEGRYEIVRSIKAGGMGAVYEAKDIRLGSSRCAIKEMLDGLGQGSDAAYFRKKFQEEMNFLAHLDHPGIPKVRDFFERGTTAYVVMDFVDGKPLDEELALCLATTGKPPGAEDVVEEILQVLEVLGYLHHRQPPVIHRDIKPGNLIRSTSGRLKVVDFGLARVAEGVSQTLVGTIGYCAPEQFSGRAQPRSDLFSVGVTMHHLLSGVTPAFMHLPPLSETMPNFDPILDGIIQKATTAVPDDRYADAEAMAADLREWQRSHASPEVSPRLRLVSSSGASRPSAPADQPPSAVREIQPLLGVQGAFAIQPSSGVQAPSQASGTKRPLALRPPDANQPASAESAGPNPLRPFDPNPFGSRVGDEGSRPRKRRWFILLVVVGLLVMNFAKKHSGHPPTKPTASASQWRAAASAAPRKLTPAAEVVAETTHSPAASASPMISSSARPVGAEPPPRVHPAAGAFIESLTGRERSIFKDAHTSFREPFASLLEDDSQTSKVILYRQHGSGAWFRLPYQNLELTASDLVYEGVALKDAESLLGRPLKENEGKDAREVEPFLKSLTETKLEGSEPPPQILNDPWSIMLQINGISAWEGYIFNIDELQRIFRLRPWYKEKSKAIEFSAIEQENIARLETWRDAAEERLKLIR